MSMVKSPLLGWGTKIQMGLEYFRAFPFIDYVVVGEGEAVALPRFDLRIDDHDVADDTHLVRMRHRVFEHDLMHDLGMARVGNVENRRPVGSVLMADEGISPLDHDLPAAGNFHPGQMADIA